MGAFFLVRRQLFGQLGGFDERFFVYFEDVDFSCARNAPAVRTVYLAATQPSSRRRHVGRGHGDDCSTRCKAASCMPPSTSPNSCRRGHRRHAICGAVDEAGLVGPRLALREAWDTARGYWLLWKNMPRILNATVAFRSCNARNQRLVIASGRQPPEHNSPLKKGTGSELMREIAAKNGGCEVPVPLFQRADNYRQPDEPSYV